MIGTSGAIDVILATQPRRGRRTTKAEGKDAEPLFQERNEPEGDDADA
jgi:hypothetical protein